MRRATVAKLQSPPVMVYAARTTSDAGRVCMRAAEDAAESARCGPIRTVLRIDPCVAIQLQRHLFADRRRRSGRMGSYVVVVDPSAAARLSSPPPILNPACSVQPRAESLSCQFQVFRTGRSFGKQQCFRGYSRREGCVPIRLAPAVKVPPLQWRQYVPAQYLLREAAM